MNTKIMRGLLLEMSGKLKQKIGVIFSSQTLLVNGKGEEILGRVNQYMGRAMPTG
ncbi:MAG: hypothetical protein U0V74_03155 [Chitinophagales bacterium]